MGVSYGSMLSCFLWGFTREKCVIQSDQSQACYERWRSVLVIDGGVPTPVIGQKNMWATMRDWPRSNSGPPAEPGAHLFSRVWILTLYNGQSDREKKIDFLKNRVHLRRWSSISRYLCVCVFLFLGIFDKFTYFWTWPSTRYGYLEKTAERKCFGALRSELFTR